MEKQPTVFLVDDDEAVRESLRFLMRSVGQPIECFPNAQDFLKAFDPARPGCLLLDVRMPGISGLELMQRLSDLGNCLPILIITGHADVPMAVRAMKEGALDVLEKPFNDQTLLDKIQIAFKKNEETLRRRARCAEIKRRLRQLTPREREVMELIVQGDNNKEIALGLGISRKTLDVHRLRIFDKLGVRSVAEMVQMLILVKGLPNSN